MYWPSSLKIDQDYLLSSGSYIQRLKMYPYFDFAHYALVRGGCGVRKASDVLHGARRSGRELHGLLEETPAQLLALLHGGLLRRQLPGQLPAGRARGGHLQAT